MPPHVYAVSDNAYNDMLRFEIFLLKIDPKFSEIPDENWACSAALSKNPN